jgi:hypothetical protein
MKTLTTLLALVLTAGIALAQSNQGSTGTDPQQDRGRTGSTGSATSGQSSTSSSSQQGQQKVSAIVVSKDEDGQTITVRQASSSSASGQAGTSAGSASGSASQSSSVTLPVKEKAVSALKSVKNGERVTLTCRDDSASGSSASGSAGSMGSTGSTGDTSGTGSTSTGAAGSSAGSMSASGNLQASCSSVVDISKQSASQPSSFDQSID